jgi:hypothetical protein
MKDLVDRHEPLCSPYLTERHPDLSYLITTSAFCDPFGSGHQAALIANALDSGRHATGLRRRIYYEVWWPWFMATPIDSGADPAGLEILVDKAHACYDLLERRLPSMRRAIRDVRTAVRRRLLEIYAVSPRSRFAGAALTTLIDDYFVEQLDSK